MLFKKYTVYENKLSDALKIIALLGFQCILGYYTFLMMNFIALIYTKYFSISVYFITLFNISYVIYCYKFTYLTLRNRYPNRINTIKISFLIFYILSLLSYTFVSGSYSPFFLIGIKTAQNYVA